tara:strand:+ start:97 stop:708 length:612 start_codon:yes stop_codon:yes gene_type:complete
MNKIIFISLFFLISFLTYSEEKIVGKHLFSLKCNVSEINIFENLDQNFVILNTHIYDDLSSEVDLGRGIVRDVKAKITIYYKRGRVWADQFYSLEYSMEDYEIKDRGEKSYYDTSSRKTIYSRFPSPFEISSIKINRSNLDAKWTIYKQRFTIQQTPFEKESFDSKCEIVDSEYAQKWESSVNDSLDNENQKKINKLIEERKI